MSWLRLHPIAVAAVCAVVLIGIGVVISSGSFATTPTNDAVSWGKFEGGRLITPSSMNSSVSKHLTPDDVYDPLEAFRQENTDVLLIPQANQGIAFKTASATIPLKYEEDALEQLFKSVQASALVQPPIATEDPGFSFEDIYRYLPFSAGTPRAKAQTETQIALFNYGNEAGSAVEAYAERYSDQAEVLKRFVEDITNPAKAAEVTRVAEGLKGISEELARMEEVPTTVQSAHNRMITGYRTLGEKLETVGNARTPEALLASINDYNAAADQFAQTLIALSTIFSVSEVSFDQQEPGRRLVFSPQ